MAKKRIPNTIRQQVVVPAASASTTVKQIDKLKEFVITFNKIPRAYKINTQFVNHWHFTVRHIPAGDVLQIVNPGSRATHTEGPATILTLTIDGQAGVILRLLLKAFVNSICNTFNPPVAPWSWGTQDEDLAMALKTTLTTATVRIALRRITFGNEEHTKISEELWEEECERMAELAQAICRKCKQSPTGTQEFKRCSACKQVKYCSKDCQRADWKNHKKFCKLLSISTSETWSGTKGTEAVYDAMTYHARTSSKSPYIKTLAKKIGLKLPAKGLTTVIRRLVLTGADSPDNLLSLFGMHPTDREYIEEVHYDTRIESLLDSPKGSYFYVFAKSHNVDDTCPFRAVRKASEDEEIELELVRDMQGMIKRYMAARNRELSSIDNDDLEGILCTHFGVDEKDYYKKTYIAALNSLDLGYPSDYNPCDRRDSSRTLRHWGLSCK